MRPRAGAYVSTSARAAAGVVDARESGQVRACNDVRRDKDRSLKRRFRQDRRYGKKHQHGSDTHYANTHHASILPDQEDSASSLWQNPASHRDRGGARLTRREEGAYSQYVTDEQRSSGGMHRRSNAVGVLPQAASGRPIANQVLTPPLAEFVRLATDHPGHVVAVTRSDGAAVSVRPCLPPRERCAGSDPRDGCDSGIPIGPQDAIFAGGRSRSRPRSVERPHRVCPVGNARRIHRGSSPDGAVIDRADSAVIRGSCPDHSLERRRVASGTRDPRASRYAEQSSISRRRRSNRSDRAYAVSTLFCTTCASAASMTSRGWSVSSAAQSRNEDRKPCDLHRSLVNY